MTAESPSQQQHAGTFQPPGVLKRTAEQAGKNRRRRLGRTQSDRKHNCCWFPATKRKTGKLTFLGFPAPPSTPQAFAGHKDGPIMVSLYMPLSDVKQNSKSVVSALPTVDTTVIIFTTASPHHCSVAAAADTPTRGYNLPVLSQFTLCKQRLHLGPSPGPCRGRAVLLLSPSGRRGDGLINMERERGRAEREEGREGGGMESTCGKLHKRWLFAPGEEKQLRKHVPVKVAKKK